MKKINIRLSQRMRELRRKYNLTQEKLAEIAGVDYKHIQRLEGKKPNDARLSTVEKIAKAFNISLSKFLDF